MVNTAVSRPHVVMALQLAGLVLKVCLSYLLILGGFGLPPMGAVGGAVASVIVFRALFLMGFGYMQRSSFYRRFVIHWMWPRWPVLREILQLGIPMSLSYALEATSFTAITLLAARLGTTVMGGHQVAANLAALCFMLPLSLSVATATLTAQAIGAGDPRRARETALLGMRLGALVAGGATVLTVCTLRGGIVHLYTRDPAVAAMALTLIPYLAAFHFFDALQTVASFVLRAYKLAIAPTVIHAAALWGLGVVGGYFVAFGGLWGPPWGIAGMWLMQSVALALAALLLVGFYLGLPRFRWYRAPRSDQLRDPA
jgi:MATE family multidrug resistance protein